jgi:hypothetical protein
MWYDVRPGHFGSCCLNAVTAREHTDLDFPGARKRWLQTLLKGSGGRFATDIQLGQLLRFNQRNEMGRTPCMDGREIRIEIPLPAPRHRRRLLLARTEGDADLAIATQ